MQPDEIIKSAVRAVDAEIKGLKAMKNNFGDSFVKAVQMITAIKGRVIISGMGKSGHIGQKIAATLSSTGTPTFFVHPGEASHGDLGILTEQDLLLTISNSGESKEMGDIISYSRRFAIPMIAITSNPESSMAQAADLILLIPDKKTAPEACPLGLAPTTSTTATLVMGDALAIALIEQKGFSADDFRIRHPGGKLGNSLLRVKDIMATGDEMPLVLPDMPMSEALIIMTQKSWGCLGVTDKKGCLIGIITDGDLRRHIVDILSKKVKDVMSPNPLTIIPDILCAEALHIMNTKKITSLFAVNGENKPVGLLHMHPLLMAKIA